MKAQEYFYHKRKLGWLCLPLFHVLLENFVREKEQGFSTFKVVYSGWYQGLFPADHATEDQLKKERNRYYDLIHAGVEPKYEPMSATHRKEKGVDVAMAVDALQVGLQGKMDVAVLVTGDGDFVPLGRALMKEGTRVMIAHFEYEDNEYSGLISKRLLNASNYALNINALEKDGDYQAAFRRLFRQSDKQNGLGTIQVETPSSLSKTSVPPVKPGIDPFH
jgi:uncharacterized LabA/DUF88 family protein